MSLCSIPIGSKAVLLSCMEKFQRFGLFPGTIVKVMYRGPFGGPIIIKFSDTSLAIGKDLCCKIEVKLIE